MTTANKTFINTDVSGARQNVKDIQVFGNGDTFTLICKASSQAEGWMKSTKACEVEDLGCLVQVTTQQRNPDDSYAVAEAVTWCPGVHIVENDGIRKLVPIEMANLKEIMSFLKDFMKEKNIYEELAEKQAAEAEADTNA